MIDIQAPHSSTHTAKDFLIHMSAICLGILIAIGLEQTAEVIHHHHQRQQLEQDLRAEAQRNVATIQANQKNFGVYMVWYRNILKAGREAKPSAGFVTFVIPPRVTPRPASRPMDNVWPAAKASGAVAVLSRDEVETFGRISAYAERAEDAIQLREAGDVAENAVLNRLGLTLAPGSTVRMTPQDRDELMRAVATHLEGYRQLSVQDAVWQGASDAVLHGVSFIDGFTPYIRQAEAARPQ